MQRNVLATLCVLLVVLLAPAAITARVPDSSVPLVGGCVPGAAYDPACDADRDGDVDIFDIQLTAGHWSQSGPYVSDNNHNHLGQTWTGSNNPLKLTGSYGTAPDNAALVLSNSAAGGNGLEVDSAYTGVRVNSSSYGTFVNSASLVGAYVNQAGYDGVFVHYTGSPSTSTTSADKNGFEVAGAEGHGLYVGRADQDGVRVNSAGFVGVYVNSADSYGVGVSSAGTDGMYVNSAGNDGVHVASAGNYAGWFGGNIYVSGNCVGCLQANFAVNAGEQALRPGDVVSVLAVASTDLDTAPALWRIVQAQGGQAVVGVVAGRAELDVEEEHGPAESGRRLAPRAGAAQPGEYVTVVYSGPMQVRVAADAGAIAAGTRLTVAADGGVRPVGVLKVQLADGRGTADMPETAPLVGVALDAPQDGMVWVLVSR